MNHLKVKDNDHLYRDVNTGAIINTDRSSFEKYKKSKLKFQNMEQELVRVVKLDLQKLQYKKMVVDIMIW